MMQMGYTVRVLTLQRSVQCTAAFPSVTILVTQPYHAVAALRYDSVKSLLRYGTGTVRYTHGTLRFGHQVNNFTLKYQQGKLFTCCAFLEASEAGLSVHSRHPRIRGWTVYQVASLQPRRLFSQSPLWPNRSLFWPAEFLEPTLSRKKRFPSYQQTITPRRRSTTTGLTLCCLHFSSFFIIWLS